MAANVVDASHAPFEVRLSYAEPDDPVWKRLLIRGIEQISGRPHLEKLYREIRKEPFSAANFWRDSLAGLNVTLAYDHERLESIPKEGPLVFIANHPFGVIDGLSICFLASLVRSNFQILVNSVLCQDPKLEPYMLPVDFDETRDAMRTNIRTKHTALKTLETGGAIVIFPGGGVATANGWFGPVQDLEWKRFTANLVQSAKADVVPLFFHGQNGWLFQMVSQFSLTLRLALLLNEARKKIGSTIQVTVGQTIPFSELQTIRGRQPLIDNLRKRVYALRDG